MEREIQILPCTSDDQLHKLADLADQIWHEYFPFLLSEEQIDYMVNKFCSFESMKDYEKHHHYHFFLVLEKETAIGYIALGHEEERLFLSKLYLSKAVRGQGLASQLFQFIKEHANRYQYDTIYLTCNKHNSHSLDVYWNWGFKTVAEDVTDIGRGYVMDDYILEYKLSK